MGLVSIIVPVHNTAPYLKRCVDSISGQTLGDIEIILVENLSTDGSYGLCDELAERDPRIRVLHLDTAGLSHARNRGVEVATSDYVGFVDSDDRVIDTMYEELYAEAKKHDADIVSCNFLIEENGVCLPGAGNDGTVRTLAPSEMVKEIFEEKISSSACTKLFRRTVFDSFAFPEGRYFEDHSIVYKMAAASKVCVYINRPMYVYYQREGSICHSMNPIKRYHFFLADYERISFLLESGMFREEEKKMMVKNQVDLCVFHFYQFLNLGGAGKHKDEMSFMRRSLINCLQLDKEAVCGKSRQRILKLKYLFPAVLHIHGRKYNRSLSHKN